MPQYKTFHLLMVILLVSSACSGGSILALADAGVPLGVRQENAKGLLRLWSFASKEFGSKFDLSNDSELNRLNTAVDFLSSKTNRLETTGTVPAEVRRYLVWVLARAKMLASLDYSETNLRHFYQINRTRYSCQPRASISEFTVPRRYVSAFQGRDVLLEFKNRINTNDFNREAYEITGLFGSRQTGFRGELSKTAVGNDRFSLYELALEAGGIGGPFPVSDGYLFVQVHSLLSESGDCFEYYRNRVETDFSREWLKKVYQDTLTTSRMSLKIDVTPVTSATRPQDTAFVVEEHAVTFAKARASLSFLYGDEKTTQFWESIQRQALEIELIYHGELGKEIRESDQFRRLLQIQLLINDAEIRMADILRDSDTTAVLEQVYSNDPKRYSEISTISGTLFKCSTESTDGDPVRCAAKLEMLGSSEDGYSHNTSDVITSETITGRNWTSLGREFQYACQELKQGEWSKVFFVNGMPQIVHLTSIDRKTPQFDQIVDRVRNDHTIAIRDSFWLDFAGLAKCREN